jgi:nitrogen fixation protein NifB
MENFMEQRLIAVGSRTGIFVDEHLGFVKYILIYEYKCGEIRLIQSRKIPQDDEHGDARWLNYIEIIKDCEAVLVTAAGARPKKIFRENGIRIILTKGTIEENLNEYFNEGILTNEKTGAGCGSSDCNNETTACMCGSEAGCNK